MTPLLDCVEIDPPGRPSGVVLLLHGLGASGHDFEWIVPALGLPAVRFVFPHAPVRPITINRGMAMRAWCDILSFDPIPERESSADVSESARQIDALIRREVEAGTPTERIVLAGFSQGAAMTLHAGLAYSERFAGLVVLSGFFPAAAPRTNEIHPANRSTPVFFGHGRQDPVVPFDAGRAAHDRLAAEGDRDLEWHEYDPMAHGVCPAEAADVAIWLQRQLGGDS